jgi:hypothetical protein
MLNRISRNLAPSPLSTKNLQQNKTLNDLLQLSLASRTFMIEKKPE